MLVRICKHCGKYFFTRSKNKDYCSIDCRHEFRRLRQMEDKQPCWSCKNACGSCSWSRNFIPVKGWVAERTTIRDSEGDISTYKIIFCPKYKSE